MSYKTSSLYYSIASALKHYKSLTPSYHRIQMLHRGMLTTDHIALRTFQSEGGIQFVKNALIENDVYKSGGTLEIPQKHLHAEWFYTRHPQFERMAPRIFVSEIEESKLSTMSRSILKNALKSGFLTFKDYFSINEESEYAGWSLLHGRAVNHVAVDVPEETKIEEFVQDLKSKNYNINTFGGEIKTSKDGMIHQASVMSDIVKYHFVNEEGKFEQKNVPGFFVEFVQRDKDTNNRIREGFESQNALHIFDSTRGELDSPNPSLTSESKKHD